MAAHVHAKEMMQYAKDAMETDKPWERWQVRRSIGGAVFSWFDCKHDTVMFDSYYKYRRKPKMMRATCADGTVVEWPEPVKNNLDNGTEYWIIRPSGCTERTYWNNSDLDKHFLAWNKVHLTEEAAIQHYEALQAIDNGSANWRDKS